MTSPAWSRRKFISAATAATVATAAAPTVTPAGAAPKPRLSVQAGMVNLEWFGWSHFRLTSPNGKVVLLNPWINGNPDASVSLDDITKADLILVSDGHRDEVGNTTEIAQATGALVYVPFELGTWFMEQGVPMAQVRRSNPGERLMLDGITVRMVGSVHGSGLPAPSSTTPYGGPAAGFFITFENKWTIYFQGSSAATMDMAMWAELYKPDAMIFHMNAGKEPLDAAMAIAYTRSENPNLNTLIPHHHRVQIPQGGTTIDDVKAALATRKITIPIIDPVRGQVYPFKK